jgi:hypothetical protein
MTCFAVCAPMRPSAAADSSSGTMSPSCASDLMRWAALQLDLHLGVLDLFDDRLEQVDLERAGLDVDLHVDVLFGAVGTLERRAR